MLLSFGISVVSACMLYIIQGSGVCVFWPGYKVQTWSLSLSTLQQ